MDQIAGLFKSSFGAPFNSTERIYVVYVLSALLLTALVYLRNVVAAGGRKNFREFLAFAFPMHIYFHRSARVDYLYFVIRNLFYIALIAPLSLFLFSTSLLTHKALLMVGFELQPAQGVSWQMSLLWTFVLVVVTDFGLYISHWWQHKNKWLWEFHKVHHSAEVMTPITVYRMHPVDDMISVLVTSVLGGIAHGFVSFFVAGELRVVEILGLDVFLFLFYFFGYNLRHSHVWLSYGQKWSHILISPAQHQIHHSKARRHFDKNIGFIFAWWDWMFGTLYVPKEKEKIEFGLNHNEEQEYQSLPHLVFRPFVKVYRLLRS